MEYLFFDEEFAKSDDNGNICEFGYVITDDAFRILEKDNIIIDPNVKGNWDQFVLDNILSYAKDYYEVQPTFDTFYNRIKKIFNSVDYVFGHTTKGDVTALNCECKRYTLDYINYSFYDIKELYKEYGNYNRSVGLQNIIANENIETFGLAHNAMYDAGNTMLCLKKMVDELEISIKDLLFMCQRTADKTNNGIIESEELETILKNEKVIDILDGKNGNNILMDDDNSRLLHKFMNNVEPTENIDNKEIKGKKINFSSFYENVHLHEMLNLIQIIANNGGNVVYDASVCHIFIKYNLINKDGTERTCPRMKYVNRCNKRGKGIKIITLEELFNILNIKEEDIKTKELFDRKVLFKKTNHNKIDYSLYNDNVSNTLGDFFKNFIV